MTRGRLNSPQLLQAGSRSITLVSWSRAFTAAVVLALAYAVVLLAGSTMAGLGFAMMAARPLLLAPLGVLLIIIGYLIILLGGFTVFLKIVTDLVGEEVEARLYRKIEELKEKPSPTS